MSTLSESSQSEVAIILSKEVMGAPRISSDEPCAWLDPFIALLLNGTHGNEFLGLRSNSPTSLDEGLDPFHNIRGAIAYYLSRLDFCANKKRGERQSSGAKLSYQALCTPAYRIGLFDKTCAAIPEVNIQAKESNQHG